MPTDKEILAEVRSQVQVLNARFQDHLKDEMGEIVQIRKSLDRLSNRIWWMIGIALVSFIGLAGSLLKYIILK